MTAGKAIAAMELSFRSQSRELPSEPSVHGTGTGRVRHTVDGAPLADGATLSIITTSGGATMAPGIPSRQLCPIATTSCPTRATLIRPAIGISGSGSHRPARCSCSALGPSYSASASFNRCSCFLRASWVESARQASHVRVS